VDDAVVAPAQAEDTAGEGRRRQLLTQELCRLQQLSGCAHHLLLSAKGSMMASGALRPQPEMGGSSLADLALNQSTQACRSSQLW